MDVYRRRQAMKNIEEGNFTQEDVDVLYERDLSEKYGDIETLMKEDLEGMNVEANYRNEMRNYWIPSDKCLATGGEVWVDQAYRIFNQNEETMEVREVQNPNEIEAVLQGVYSKIRKTMDRLKRDNEKNGI